MKTTILLLLLTLSLHAQHYHATAALSGKDTVTGDAWVDIDITAHTITLTLPSETIVLFISSTLTDTTGTIYYLSSTQYASMRVTKDTITLRPLPGTLSIPIILCHIYILDPRYGWMPTGK